MIIDREGTINQSQTPLPGVKLNEIYQDFDINLLRPISLDDAQKKYRLGIQPVANKIFGFWHLKVKIDDDTHNVEILRNRLNQRIIVLDGRGSRVCVKV